MKVLREGVDVDDFFGKVRRASHRILLLDYDGTLAPFREDPDEATPYPRVREVLGEIVAEGRTRLVVISGRPVADLLPLLRLEPPPEVWGSHGWERRRAGGPVTRGEVGEAASAGLSRAMRVAERHGWGASAERKPGSLALHWRSEGDGGRREMARRLVPAWRRIAADSGLRLERFDGGVELRVPGRDKGYAVRRVLEEFGPDAAVACLGDGRTDEDAFRELGDRGLAVLVRPELRDTAADLWLRPPDELLGFLRRWRSEVGERGAGEEAAPGR